MLGIYSDHFGEVKPSIGGILLFSHEHTEIFPDSTIQCAYFKGNTKELLSVFQLLQKIHMLCMY